MRRLGGIRALIAAAHLGSNSSSISAVIASRVRHIQHRGGRGVGGAPAPPFELFKPPSCSPSSPLASTSCFSIPLLSHGGGGGGKFLLQEEKNCCKSIQCPQTKTKPKILIL